MKKLILGLLLASFFCVSHGHSVVEGERFLQSEEAVKTAAYGHIDAKGLKSLINSGTSFILLDARGHKWKDGQKIPGAIMASFEDAAEIETLVPNKDTLIVFYCYSFTCPLCAKLGQKLVVLGYQNLIEYPAGLKEWRDVANYPVESIE